MFHKEKECFTGFNQKLLNEPPKDAKQLNALLNVLSGEEELYRHSLENAILLFTDLIRERQLLLGEAGEPWDFFRELLPEICEWASDDRLAVEVPILRTDTTASVRLSSAQILHILSNAFLLNCIDLKSTYAVGSLDFSAIYKYSKDEVAVQRVLCLLAYFYESQRARRRGEPERWVAFERQTTDTWPNWPQSPLPLDQTRLHFHAGSIEDTPATGIVAFSHRHLHLGCVLPSSSLEEVLFNCCPECFVGLLFVERFSERDHLLMRNVKKFSSFCFSGSRFVFEGLAEDGRGYDVVVLDGVVGEEMSLGSVVRDLNKAWGCFSSYKKSVSSTHWGYSSLIEDETLKFFVQLMAAIEAGIDLYYTTSDDTVTGLRSILHTCELAQLNISHVISIIQQYTSKNKQTSFHSYFLKTIKKMLVNTT